MKAEILSKHTNINIRIRSLNIIKMKYAISLLLILFSINVNSQQLNLSITPSIDPVFEGSNAEYTINFTRPSSGLISNLVFTATVTGGTILFQDLDPFSTGLYIKIRWNCGISSGTVQVTETSTAESANFTASILNYSSHGFCQNITPPYQIAYFGETPQNINILSCSNTCISLYNFTFQWQVADVVNGNVIGSFIDIQGSTSIDIQATSASFQPPVLNSNQLINNISKAYRRRTVYVIPGSGGQSVTVNSNTAIVSYYHRFEAGSIQTSNRYIYSGTMPIITQLPAFGGTCASNYHYTWQRSVNGGVWTDIGSNVAYQSGYAFTLNTRIRRKVVCENEEMFSNTIEFIIVSQLTPGSIAGGGIVPFNSLPSITQTPAQNGRCNLSDYSYSWERSVDNGPWDVIGTSVEYPATVPIIGNTKIRRSILCGGEILFTNTITFTLLSYYTTNYENRNYIRVNEIMIPGIRSWEQADALSIGDKIQSTEYFDGIGRVIQTVVKQVSIADPALDPNNLNSYQDYVNITSFDNLGRQAKNYLGYSSSQSIGFFKINAAQEQREFINNYYNEPANSDFTFATNTFDNSPQNRIINTKLPGSLWNTNPIYMGISSDYQVYDASLEQVLIWQIGYGHGELPITLLQHYETGKLIKYVTKDDRNKLIVEFKDFSGNIILKKIQEEDAVELYSYGGWLCTYYVYDDFNRLRYIIPPQAVHLMHQNGVWDVDSDMSKELCSYVEFDKKGRTIVQHSPGGGETWSVYDNRNRLILSQTENQRYRNQWSFSLYDQYDRNVATGLMDNSKDQRFFADYVETQLLNETITIEIQTDVMETLEVFSPLLGIQQSTGIDFCPGNCTNIVLNAINYYDKYYSTAKPFEQIAEAEFAPSSNPHKEKFSVSMRIKGMSTQSKIRVLDDNYDNGNPYDDLFLLSTNYFDEKLNVIQSLSENIRRGVDVFSIQYDFSGNTLSTIKKHQTNNSSFINASDNLFTGLNVITKSEFDLLRRPIRNFVLYTFNLSDASNPANYKKLSEARYDPFGRISWKKVGANPTEPQREMEQMDYSYNIQGWLTGVNKDYATAQYPGNQNFNQFDRRFGYYLGYVADGITVGDLAQFNGNISTTIWRSQGDNTPRKYIYFYDNVNRFRKAVFSQINNFGPPNYSTQWSNSKVDFTSVVSSYDKNGNILGLSHHGIKPGHTGGFLIDDLVYQYQTNSNNQSNSNKLLTITDNALTGNSGIMGDFKDETHTTEYYYDRNGNQTSDLNKKIGDGLTNPGIIYNFLDLPQSMPVIGKSITAITYDASGVKLARKITDEVTGQVKNIYYVDEFIYYDDKLQYILNEEGKLRIIKPVTGANAPSFSVNFLSISGNVQLGATGFYGVYDYNLKDNLSNVRMVLTEESHTQEMRCSMENDPANPTNVAPEEEELFGQSTSGNNEVINTRKLRATTPWPATANSSTYVCALKKALPNATPTSIGPNVMLKVMAGDLLSGKVDYFYYSNTPNSDNQSILLDLVSSFVNVMSANSLVSSSIKDNSAQIFSNYSAGSSPINSYLSNNHPPVPNNTPRAYLNYLFFDEQFNYISENSGALPVANWPTSNPVDGIAGNLPFTNIVAPKNGYVYVYLSNESSNITVYFDNFMVNHKRGSIVEDNAYYPYGLKIAGISSKAFDAPKNPYQYQGDYAEFDEESGYNEFYLRNYDPQIGRFVQADPFKEFPSPYTGMGNDPVNNVDPSGGSILSSITGSSNLLFNTAAASMVGVMVGGIVGMFNGDENAWKKGAAIGAGLGLLDGVGSGIYNQLSNLGTTLPTVGGNILNVLASPTTAPPSPTAPPGTPPNSLVRVYVKHGKTKADGGDNSWDVWDGHTLLQVDNMVYHFYPTNIRNGKDLSTRGLSDAKLDLKTTWNSQGEVGSMDINDQKTKDYFSDRQNANYGFSVYETSITPTQKTALLSNINKSIASPPSYKTLGTRCQSWVSGMLRSSSILPNSLRQYSWSTVPFSKALFKLPKFNLVLKTLSSKAP